VQEVLASESARLGKRVRITQCVLSHWHHDHVGGIGELKGVCGEDDGGKGVGEEDSEEKHGANLKIYKYPLYDLSSPDLLDVGSGSRERENQLLTSANNDHDIGGLHDLLDGRILSVGSAESPLELRVVHTPGHTTDHIALVIVSSPADLTEVGTIFTADTVLGHGTAVFEDLGMYMQSLTKMKDTIGYYGAGQKKAVKAFPGHGAVIPDATAKIDEYISHRAMRVKEVLKVLTPEPSQHPSLEERSSTDNIQNQGMTGLTPMQIVKVVYKEVPKTLHLAAEGGVVQILKMLEADGKVERITSSENREGEEERWRFLNQKNRRSQNQKQSQSEPERQQQQGNANNGSEKVVEAKRTSAL
jgi:glyoxylase-like metal-dependent hydrolase (beta-lactamase superfamily II)